LGDKAEQRHIDEEVPDPGEQPAPAKAVVRWSGPYQAVVPTGQPTVSREEDLIKAVD
jgi:hypothetical protein